MEKTTANASLGDEVGLALVGEELGISLNEIGLGAGAWVGACVHLLPLPLELFLEDLVLDPTLGASVALLPFLGTLVSRTTPFLMDFSDFVCLLGALLVLVSPQLS